MLEFIKIINSDYAGVLSLLSSLIMVVVTIIYVGHTKRQANYAKESAELVAKQMKIDKQPCIVPYVTDSCGSAWDTTDYTRMQLGFTIKLRNVGDSPAINVYTLADIELQFSEDSAGNKKLLPASLLPGFTQALSAEEETDINIHFETSEVKALICELNSVYTRSSQNSTPNSNATNLHCCQKRCCSFGISSSNASPAFQVQKSIFHQMTKPIQVTVILPLLLAISLSRNDDIHSSISGISNDLLGVIPTIGQ